MGCGAARFRGVAESRGAPVCRDSDEGGGEPEGVLSFPESGVEGTRRAAEGARAVQHGASRAESRR
eukprot:1340528-Prymnesium_polylepis.1